MIRSRSILAALLTGGLLAASAQAAGEFSVYYTKARGLGLRSSSPSANSGLRRQVSQAERDLAKAYAASTKADTSSNDVKAAQNNLNTARRDYTALLAAARKALDDHPQVAPHCKVVRDLQARVAGETDLRARASLSMDLIHARGKMNAVEAEVLSLDPDIALAKAAVGDAMAALKLAQAGGQSQRQQDPTVAAARQRLQDLRRQLAGR